VSDRTIAKKIRELSARKIPLIAVVGEKEAMNQSLNLRRLGIARQQEIQLAELEAELMRRQKAVPMNFVHHQA
jgi:threonyl-tRNA synthetase